MQKHFLLKSVKLFREHTRFYKIFKSLQDGLLKVICTYFQFIKKLIFNRSKLRPFLPEIVAMGV